jgi:hypothetical protein
VSIAADELGYQVNNHARLLRISKEKKLFSRMNEKAIIYHVDINIMVEQIPSIIKIWVVLIEKHLTIMLEDKLPISELSLKYDFYYNGIEIDLSEMIKRDCFIEEYGNSYRFVSYN